MEIIEGMDYPGAAGRRTTQDGSRGAAQVGRLVRSNRGRDRGRYYLVVGVESETMVLVADGEVRRVDSPKRKNIRHLKSCDVIAGEVYYKSLDGKRVTNVDVRRELKSLIEKLIE